MRKRAAAARRAEVAAQDAKIRKAQKERAKRNRRGRKNGMGEEGDPSIAVSPQIYGEFQQVRSQLDRVIGSSPLKEIRSPSVRTGAKLGELFQSLTPNEIDTVLRQADLDIEIRGLESRSKGDFMAEKAYRARMQEAAARRAAYRDHQRRIRLIKAGVLKTFDEVELDDSMLMIVPGEGGRNGGKERPVGAEDLEVVAKSSMALLGMDPDALRELLEGTREGVREGDPISMIADAHDRGRVDGGRQGEDGEDGEGGEGGGGEGDYMYLSALGKTKVEAEAGLKELQNWTNKRLLEGLDVSTTLLFDE